jgi:hypothetical protein
MLAISNHLYFRVFGGRQPYCKVPSRDLDGLSPTSSLRPIDPDELMQVAIRCLLDAVVVGGIVFFSSLVGIGWQNFFEVARVSFLSAGVTIGLNFFYSLRKYLSGGGL